MEKDKTIALRVPAKMAERIKRQAEKEMITSSAWVRRAVLNALQVAEASNKK